MRRMDEALLNELVDAAVKAGADAAEAVSAQRRSLSITVRLGELEEVEREESRDLGLRVFVGRRQASVSGSDVSAEARAFTLGHVAELAALRESGTAIDWLVVAPPPTMLDDDAPRTGEYRTGGSTAMAGDGREFAYADLAVALVDQVENPAAHRAMISVGY